MNKKSKKMSSKEKDDFLTRQSKRMEKHKQIEEKLKKDLIKKEEDKIKETSFIYQMKKRF